MCYLSQTSVKTSNYMEKPVCRGAGICARGRIPRTSWRDAPMREHHVTIQWKITAKMTFSLLVSLEKLIVTWDP